jgi:uncharacterized integral membrane protein
MQQHVDDPRQEAWPIFRSVKFWGVVAAVALLLVFTFQNTKAFEMHILVWSFTASGAFLVLGTSVLGFAAGWVLRSARGPGFSLFG